MIMNIFKLRLNKFNSSYDLILVIFGAILLSLVAIINFGPIFFDDTGVYLLTAIDTIETGWPSISWSRPPYYSFFLYFFHWKITLWPVVFFQALIISHLVYLALRTANVLRLHSYLLTITALVSLTSIPWFTAQLTPDLFTPAVVLGIVLLSFFYQCLSGYEITYLICLTAFAITTHFSHLPLASGLVVAFIILFLIKQPCNFIRAKGLFLCIIPVVIALGIMSGVQVFTKGTSAVAPHGPLFILARYLEDGPAREYLTNVCPDPRYRLCAYMDDLNRSTAWFLWNKKNSPLYKIGVNEANREAKDILIASFKEKPVAYIQAALANTLKQFFRYNTATWVRPYVDEEKSITHTIKKHFPKYYENGYFDTLQNHDLLGIGFLKNIQYIIALIAMVISVLALFFLNAKEHSFYLKLFISIWLALVGNAFICGALSIVTDRYQSRVVWLVVLLVLLAYFNMKGNTHKTV